MRHWTNTNSPGIEYENPGRRWQRRWTGVPFDLFPVAPSRSTAKAPEPFGASSTGRWPAHAPSSDDQSGHRDANGQFSLFFFSVFFVFLPIPRRQPPRKKNSFSKAWTLIQFTNQTTLFSGSLASYIVLSCLSSYILSKSMDASKCLCLTSN